MRAGTVVVVPDVPGRWSVWSQTNDAPGAHCLVPMDSAASALGIEYVVVRVVRGTVVKVLWTERRS